VHSFCPKLIDTLRPGNESALHLAARYGQYSAIKTLLACGSKMASKRTTCGKTPLYYACDANRVRASKLLLKHDPQIVDIGDTYGSTPLHIAVHRNNYKLVELLINSGSNAFTKEVDCRTPISLAIQLSDINIVEELAKSSRKSLKHVDRYGLTLIHDAAMVSSKKIIHLFWLGVPYSYLDKVTCDGISPLELCFDNNVINTEVCKTLCLLGARNTVGFRFDFIEQESLEVRYRAFFSRSLTSRLLDFVEKLKF
jgi:ankyrin repeat protein